MKTEQEQKRLDEYVARVVASFPPLSAEQIDRIAVLLRGGPIPKQNREPSAADIERRQKEAEAEKEHQRVRKLAESITACDVCSVPLDKHAFAESSSEIQSHKWQSGRADKILRGIEREKTRRDNGGPTAA